MSNHASQKRYQEALKAMKALEGSGFEARLAGGCVRDRLFGVEPKDFDIATTATPDQIAKAFEKVHIKTVPTGIDHGTLTAVYPEGGIEVTTLRRDVATDGRRATVAFSQSFEEDAARRDFTINAMFEDGEGKVHDYFGGKEDLRQRVLRFVGEPRQRIREDFLRILRFFRFWSRYSLIPAEGSLAAIRAECAGLRQLSQERVTSELLGILSSQKVMAQLEAMATHGIWEIVLPWFVFAQVDQAGKWVEGLAAVGKEPPRGDVLALMRLATFDILQPQWSLQDAHSIHQGIATMGKKLRLSTQVIHQIEVLVGFGQRVATSENVSSFGQVVEVMDWAEALGGATFVECYVVPFWQAFAENFGELAMPETVRRAGREDESRSFSALLGDFMRIEGEMTSEKRRSSLPLDGHDIAEKIGITPGKELGNLLRCLRIAFLEGRWSTKAEGLILAKKLRDEEMA